jgi:SAM-dependent methyltransferase
MDWLDSGAGFGLLQEEFLQVRSALDSIFGDHFLQLGSWGGDDFREFARTRRTVVIDEVVRPGVDLRSALDNLGIISDSVDVVLLPHVLEMHRDPHGVLREVDRILRSDGHVIILGFNPVSFWGLRHYLTRRRFPPQIHRMISEHRLRDWLRLLNFAVDHSSFRYYHASMLNRGNQRSAAPVETENDHRHASGPAKISMDATYRGNRFSRAARSSISAGIRGWRRYAPFAGCYLLVARKEMFTLTPVRAVWKRRARLVGGLVNPTTRTTL